MYCHHDSLSPLLITIHSDISPTVLLILPISPRYFDNDGWVGDKEQYDGWDKLQSSKLRKTRPDYGNFITKITSEGGELWKI